MTKKEIPLSIARRKMFFDYLDELNAIEGLKPNSEAAKIAVYSEISSEPHTEWVDIFTEDGKPAGFLILGTPPNCCPLLPRVLKLSTTTPSLPSMVTP